jgi:probable HAF family extracellular repeat protein
MASAGISSIRSRGIAAIVGGVVFALAVAVSAPAGAGAQAPASLDVPVSPFVLGSPWPAPAASAQAQATPSDVTPIALGYLLDDGVFTRVDGPGPNLETVPYGINNRRKIVGGYVDAGGTAHGFVQYKGRFRVFDVPDASGTDASRVINYPGAAAFKINNRGQIVGSYTGADGTARGFLKMGGRLTTLHVPGAVETLALDINDRGQVVGFYIDAGGTFHGFVWERGVFEAPIDFPSAGGTTAWGINNRGHVVGSYLDLSGDQPAQLGFLLDRGDFTKLDFPGGIGTAPLDVNNRGQVVGLYLDSARRQHGFVKDRRTFTTIDAPGGPTSGATGLNDRGQITAFSDLRGRP